MAASNGGARAGQLIAVGLLLVLSTVHVAVDGSVWEPWSTWSPCPARCRAGIRTRHRSCQVAWAFYTNPCIGVPTELGACPYRQCPVDGVWEPWSAWTDCPVTCGGGIQTRNRSCVGPFYNGKPCTGKFTEQKRCASMQCSVDGVWQPWSAWTDCPVTCGGGIKIRRRSCVGPFYNGKPCAGSSIMQRICAVTECPDGCELISCYPGVTCTTIPGLAHIGICGDCLVGYEGDGLNCSNINECEEAQPCADDTLCQDTDGGFRCLPCISLGLYVGESRVGSGLADARSTSSKQICTDVDECESGTHDCYALCENTPGSFICSPCPAGYVGRSGRGCRLVDACEANLHNCDIESSYCVPKGGYAFTCECVEIGYLKYNGFCFRDEDLDGVPNIANSSCIGVQEWLCRKDNCPQVPNPQQEDTDGDGEGDACDEDSDNDGTDDILDNCRLTVNPSQRDSDNDGVGNHCDNCVSTYNPDQGDLFPGGDGNACEYDADRDGVPNSQDNCWLVVNRYQQDLDGDGVGDHCDNCVREINPDQADQDQDVTGDACDTGEDRDRDGIQDDQDVCPCTPNTAQADHDRGYGVRDRVNDACDEDDDNDLIPDSEDNCILVPNPLQTTSRYNRSIGEACYNDYDGDRRDDDDDVCPYNAVIWTTHFKLYRSITLEESATAAHGLANWELIGDREWETSQPGDPSATISRFAFNNVTFSSDVFVNSNDGDGFIGIVFSYQSVQNFYVALWKRTAERREFRGRSVLSSTSVMIKRISATSFGNLREALWSENDLTDQDGELVSKVLWSDIKLQRGWLHKQTYRWEIQHQPVQGVMRLIIHEGAQKIIDSGEQLLDSDPRFRLNGGRVGLFAYDQQYARFSRINYKCDDLHPSLRSHTAPPCDIRRN